ncbi:acetate--CoA ligase [Yanghanlia caeni]|uniref:Acetyl-coenzyme A synthetase n=1 Tax=Yanghanlia caeni TaxID=3064283 RepID=A0ABU1D492_9BURK|nr:acetate--CoA ligase [Alcaligenaceae bacterium LG-2]NGR09307.1 acetate--CoA ligase [bacterium SGD-2]HZH56486.1 acetate--CoA ligase [Burkholderiaceae bacterium]
MSSTINTMLVEERVFGPFDEFAANARISGMEQYRALADEANQDPEGFWRRMAESELVWHKPFTKVLDESNAPFYTWFEDGELNVSENCLDVHLQNGNADKVALIFEADDGKVETVTYRQLHARVCRIANGIRAMGYGKGDRAILYLPMSIEAVAIMQACARLGLTHSVVFGGFSARSLHQRVVDVGARLVFTADAQLRGGRQIPLKSAVDEALSYEGGDIVEKIVVYKRAGSDITWNDDRDVWLHDIEEGQPEECTPEYVGAEHPLFVLYTSGSTGKPKGVQHSSGGYLLWAKLTTNWVFDAKPDDIFWCTADVGWVTGHTYITYGSLAAGLTQIVFEGIPTYPNAGRFWEMIQRHKVTIFYTAPTAIRSLIKASEQNPDHHPRHYDLSSLRLLGSVGEPINPEAWVWYFENVGRSRCPVVDTWWQTETGGHILAPLPGATPLKPGSCTLPLPGVDAAVVDESGNELPPGAGGLLVIRRPWPSMIRAVWGDENRYKTSYFPSELKGMYLAGDNAQRDEDGYFWILGRTDDVLSVSGHRLGGTEIESALVAHELVAEAAIVGRPDATTGEAVVAFIMLKQAAPTGEEAQKIANQLRDWVAQQVGPIAKPRDIRFGNSLPKTRSGKIMRRLLRLVAEGRDIDQDTSTLENPDVLKQFSGVY